MNNANRSFPKLSTILLGSVMLLAVSVSIWGRPRQSPTPISVGGIHITGVPDDWSHHHLVFSDPGTEEDAVRNHTHDKWLKIVDDPRYIFQQLKRSLPVQGPAAYDVGTTEGAQSWEATRMEESARTNDVRESGSKKKNNTTITRDWSMNLGSAAGASLTAMVGTTINSTTLPTGSSFTIDGQTFTASAPVAEIATAQFTGEPSTSSSISLGGVTYGFSTAGTISAPASGCTIKASSNTSTDATLLYHAIADSGSPSNTTWECASGATPNSVLSAASPSSSTVTLTAKTAGSAGFTESTSGSTVRITYTVTTAGSNGTNSSTGFAYSTGSAYVSQSTLASNIAAALGMNSTITATYTIGTAGSPSAGDIVITNKTVGTGGNGQTLTSSFTALTGGTFAGGEQNGSVGAGTYPAKYSFSTTTANCGNATTPDYAVYNTGVAGSSTQPSIIAYDNLYSGCTAPYPQIYWQYNTNGGTVGTSPVLSSDGTQVAFMQTTGNAASLVILKWSKSATLTTLPNTVASSYYGCTAPCMTVLSLSGGADDSNSSPYYDYGSDTLYVGDDAGKLHKFVNVFNGMPAESASNGWPVTVSTQSTPTLTSPISDSNSALLYLGDAGGYLYSVTTTGSSSQLVVQSYQLAVSPGIIDAPLVDPVAGEVYVFVGEDMNGSNSNSPCVPGTTGACNGVYQLPAAFTATTKWKESIMGVGTTNPVYIGAFDNIYYSSSNSASPTGNLYVCGYIGGSTNEPKLMNVTVSANALTGSTTGNPTVTNGTMVNATNVDKPMTSAAAACSPVTEFYNSTSPATDWIFLSVSANGNLSSSGPSDCSGGACVYSFNVTAALTGTTAPVAGLAATGGASGIIIDNSVGSGTLSGASQIYFSTINSQSCAGNSMGTGAGTGGCAVQASQSALQ